jgi:hypothetical protein
MFIFLFLVFLIGIFMEKSAEKTTQSIERVAGNMVDTVLAVMDKLAGKESDLKLSFEDLTLDLGMMKARLNGAIVLDIVYAKEAETSSKTEGSSAVVTA